MGVNDARVWRNTAIVLISEFGRMNFENGSSGTDHGAGNCIAVLGGAVHGGIYGGDLTDTDLDRPLLDYDIDFRTVYGQLLDRHLGVDPAPVFPEPREKSTSPGTFI